MHFWKDKERWRERDIKKKRYASSFKNYDRNSKRKREIERKGKKSNRQAEG